MTAELADGTRLRSRYLVGCDGGRSTVRKLLGVGFPGEPATGEAVGRDGVDRAAGRGGRRGDRGPQDPAGVRCRPRSGTGCTASSCPPRGWPRTARSPPTLEEFRQQLRATPAPTSACTRRAGCPASATPPGWPSGTGSAGCCWPATPRTSTRRLGGQGLNLGLQDAFNLGWKLAAEVDGWAPEGLLDSYHAERHPVAADVLTTTRAQSELMSTEPGPQAVRRLVAELMDFEEVNRYLIEKITAIGIRYDLGAGHALLGRRLRDVALSGVACTR